MSKQDRQGVRTPADLERKYDFGLLAGQSNATSELSNQINQLNQSMAIFEASTNGSIEQLSGEIDDLEQAVSELIQGGGSGGSNVAIVTVETDSLDTETIHADRTFAEIESLILEGKTVKVKLVCEGQNIYLQVSAHMPGSEIDFCGFFDGHQLVLKIYADE